METASSSEANSSSVKPLFCVIVDAGSSGRNNIEGPGHPFSGPTIGAVGLDVIVRDLVPVGICPLKTASVGTIVSGSVRIGCPVVHIHQRAIIQAVNNPSAASR